MPKPEEITEELKKIVASCQTVLDWSKGENLSYNMMKDDMTFVRQQVFAEQSALKIAKQHTEDIKKQSEGLIEKAKLEAASILAMAREKLTEATFDREAARKELRQAQADNYLSRKQKDKQAA